MTTRMLSSIVRLVIGILGRILRLRRASARQINPQLATMNATPVSRLGQLPSLLRVCVRHAHTSSARPAKGFPAPEGHGEDIWVFTHRRSDQIIYSFEPKLSVCSIAPRGPD